MPVMYEYLRQLDLIIQSENGERWQLKEGNKVEKAEREKKKKTQKEREKGETNNFSESWDLHLISGLVGDWYYACHHHPRI